MLWKKNEFFSVRCKTKDYDDSDLKSFIDALQYIKGTSVNFEIDKILDEQIEKGLKLAVLLNADDYDYVNTVENDDSEI